MVCELYLNFKKLHEKGKAISLGSLSDPLEIGLSFEHTCVCVCVCACTLNHVQLFVTPWTVACQAPLPMEFSRQE